MAGVSTVAQDDLRNEGEPYEDSLESFKKAKREKISNSEYERAFTELAGVLYEQYRSQKRTEEDQKIINDDTE